MVSTNPVSYWELEPMEKVIEYAMIFNNLIENSQRKEE